MYRRCDRLWGELTLGTVIFQSVFFRSKSQFALFVRDSRDLREKRDELDGVDGSL